MSNKYVPRKTDEEYFEEWKEDLLNLFNQLQGTDEIKNLLNDLLTPEEMLNLAKRWFATCKLLEGELNTNITKAYPVNKNTVSRAKRTMVDGGSGICQILFERVNGASKD